MLNGLMKSNGWFPTMFDNFFNTDFCQGRGRHPDRHHAEDRAEGESHQGH